jgi:surfactin synthase thioesterase subunit
MGTINLFCFPYAGGSSVMYMKWQHYLAPGIELKPVELAGRGRRMHEGLYATLNDAIDDVFGLIGAEITSGPYALFGHSMGGAIAYGLAQKIRNLDLPLPRHLFISGRNAPHVKKQNEKKFHLMTDEVFKKEVIQLGGTPAEFFEHPELLRLFLPMLKNDFRIAEADWNEKEIDPLDVRMSVLVGKDDEITVEQQEEWKKYTSLHCSMYCLDGGHFFVNTATEQIVKIINDSLRETANDAIKNTELSDTTF